jgi:hypothetical protein
MNQRTAEVLKKVIPFPPADPVRPREDGDQVEKSGQAIIALLEEAARAAKSDCDRAFELAHELSLQLREAEERAAKFQAEFAHLEQRALRAENWMLRIYKEIEDRFLSERENGQMEPRQQYYR